MSAFGSKQTWALALHMSAFGAKTDINGARSDIANVRTIVVSVLVPLRGLFIAQVLEINRSRQAGAGDGLDLTASPLLEVGQRRWGSPCPNYVMEYSSFRYSIQRLSL